MTDHSALAIDPSAEVERICEFMRGTLRTQLHRRGAVVAISGGVDSGVCAALAVRALGASRVFGLLLPERDSSSNSVTLGKELAESLEIDYEIEDIAPTLEAIGCYARRDEAIVRVFPDYDGSWPHKLVIRGGSEGRFNHFALVAQRPSGELVEARLPHKEYLQIVAATNFKQRVRKTLEYFHADRLNFAVIGTPNKLEYDLGFFVKNGDGSADIKPIAHLYKTQVYELAKYLEIPTRIANAKPTTDTYSLDQGQDEFYFSLPYHDMDLALWAYQQGQPATALAATLGIELKKAEWVYQDIESKQKTTAPLHFSPLRIG